MTKKTLSIKLLPLWLLAAFVVGGVLGWQIFGQKEAGVFCSTVSTDSNSVADDQLLRAAVSDSCTSVFGKDVTTISKFKANTIEGKTITAYKCSNGKYAA